MAVHQQEDILGGGGAGTTVESPSGSSKLMLEGGSAVVRAPGEELNDADSSCRLGLGNSVGSAWLVKPFRMAVMAAGSSLGVSGLVKGEASAEFGPPLGYSPSRAAAVTAGSAERLRGGGGECTTVDSDSGLVHVSNSWQDIPH